MTNKYTSDTSKLFSKIDRKLLDEIKDKCENDNHSYGMIYDWLKRDQTKLFNRLNVSKKAFNRKLKSMGITFDLSQYNSKSNFWKLQYIADEKKIKHWAKSGQKKTIALRKARKHYNKKQSVEYWKNLGHSLSEAQKLRNSHVKSNSPFCEEFYVKKGWTYEAAREKLTNDRVTAALSSLKKAQKPNTEKLFAHYLDDCNYYYSTQFSVKNTIGFDRRKKLVFDFYIPSLSLIIEINGTYWHADPRVFQAKDILKFPGKKEILVEDVWKRDKNKLEVARKMGYSVVTIWEKDLYSKSKEEILEIACLTKMNS